MTPPTNPKPAPLVLIAIVCAIGTGMVGIGEFLMLYAPDGGYGIEHGYRNFLAVSPWRSHTGYFLGVLGVPIYLLGYWQIAHALRPASQRLALAVLVLGGYCTTIGNVWLGTNAYLAAIVRGRAQVSPSVQPLFDTLLREINDLSDPILQVIRGILLLVSILFVAGVVGGRSAYPRWMAAFNPVLLLVVIFASYAVVPTVGQYLVPPAMNLAHCIFFTVSAVALRITSTRGQVT